MKTPDSFFESLPRFSEELGTLRKVVLSTGMEETIKWGSPVYTWNGKNVVGLAAFKNHCALWFFQGVFLSDEAGVLLNANEGVTKALRQWRFEEGDKIDQALVKQYVLEAIVNQQAGKEMKPQPKKKAEIPVELKEAMKQDSSLDKLFRALSPSHQREFCEYISEAKREDTRQRRLEKVVGMIMTKEGLNDRYRK